MQSDIIVTVYLAGVGATFLILSITIAYTDRQMVRVRRKRTSERK